MVGNTPNKKQNKRLSLDSKEQRGERLKQLRQLTGSIPGKPMTRAAIERKHGLSARTLKNWEVGHGAGLTETGARRVINIYQNENIGCSINWLMRGTGAAPERLLTEFKKSPLAEAQTNTLVTIHSEYDNFKSLHPEAIIFQVKDDAMMPIYQVGDIVGGVRHYANTIMHLIDSDCIIEMKTGETRLRRLQHSTIPHQYNLYGLNPSTKIERPTLYAAEIVSAAPVVRIWRGKKWAQ